MAERLHRETEGNPFFLISILHALSESETQLETRASGLLAGRAAGLLCACGSRTFHWRSVRCSKPPILGRRFDFDMLLDVTHEPEERLLDAVEGLVKRRLLREEAEGGVYDFSHDKVREVVYRDIGGARRRLLHRAVAEALERRGDNQAHERDAQLAEHYERAQDWPKALRYLVLAAERSQALFAMRDALHWLDRAVALCELHPDALDERQRLALYERRGARAYTPDRRKARSPTFVEFLAPRAPAASANARAKRWSSSARPIGGQTRTKRRPHVSPKRWPSAAQ